MSAIKIWADDLIQMFSVSCAALARAASDQDLTPEHVASKFFSRYVTAKVGHEIAIRLLQDVATLQANGLTEEECYFQAARLSRGRIEADLFDNKWQPIRSGSWINPTFIQRTEALCLLRHELTIMLDEQQA